MSAAQDYYNQVLGMGHSPENALAYTRQHYPDFVPGVAEAVAAPAPTPAAQTAIPAVQPVAAPAVAATPAPAMAAPTAAVAPPMAAAPNAYAPMAVPVPAAGGVTPMMWAAVGCIVVALLLSILGQFSHSWIVDNDSEGSSFGLTTVRQDCSVEEADAELGLSKQEAVDMCKIMAYSLYAEDMEAAAAENRAADDIDDVIVGNTEDVCENSYKMVAPFFEGDEEGLKELADGRETCLETPAAGSTGGIILWVGTLGALLGAVMLGAGIMGRNLPANAEQHGKWAAIAAGVLMLLAVVVWWVLLPETDSDTSAGMGVWMTVLGGVLAIVAGVLTLREQK